jgi:hypothetical protein
MWISIKAIYSFVKNEPLIGDELLVVAFAHWPKDSFGGSDGQIAAVLYELSGRAEFKSLFRAYSFDTDGLLPDSAAIRQGLDTLRQARMITSDMDFHVHCLDQAAFRARYAKFIASRFEDDEALPSVFAAAFERELAVEITLL